MTELKHKMTELKPCPFCGGTKLTIKSCNETTEDNNFENYAVCCDFTHGGCGASSGYRPNRGEAIEAWNRRAGEQKGRKDGMKYICVRTYGNGKHMNKVYNLWFEWLSQAERVCDELNSIDAEGGEEWIPMPLNQYIGKVWESHRLP